MKRQNPKREVTIELLSSVYGLPEFTKGRLGESRTIWKLNEKVSIEKTGNSYNAVFLGEHHCPCDEGAYNDESKQTLTHIQTVEHLHALHLLAQRKYLFHLAEDEPIEITLMDTLIAYAKGLGVNWKDADEIDEKTFLETIIQLRERMAGNFTPKLDMKHDPKTN